jgi:type II secretory pathway predicted ATPase ExeA
MYERFFGFTTRPFSLTPDPSFLFPSQQHTTALTMLEYGLESESGFVLLTGEVGCGKTTLLRHILRERGDRVAVGLISNTHSSFRSVLPWALSALSIAPADDSDIAAYEALVDSFVREYARGRRTLLVVDEAQNLAPQLLEELRLLSNVNSERDLVLQILLVGQPELRETLAQPALRQLAQRIAVDFHLQPLDRADTGAYVRHRLASAGGDPGLFTAEAVDAVHQRSRGIPRLVNLLCDMSLVYAYAAGQKAVDAAIVAEVIADRARARGAATPAGPALQGAPAV